MNEFECEITRGFKRHESSFLDPPSFLSLLFQNDSLVVYGILLSSYSKYITTALNVLQSIIFQPIIQYAHQALTELENHRTQTEHNDAGKLRRSDFNPELSQLNQDFYPRYKLGLILTRNCHNLTRIFTPGINLV